MHEAICAKWPFITKLCRFYSITLNPASTTAPRFDRPSKKVTLEGMMFLLCSVSTIHIFPFGLCSTSSIQASSYAFNISTMDAIFFTQFLYQPSSSKIQGIRYFECFNSTNIWFFQFLPFEYFITLYFISSILYLTYFNKQANKQGYLNMTIMNAWVTTIHIFYWRLFHNKSMINYLILWLRM